MEENNEKNINLLPEDLKKKKKKTTLPKPVKEDFELEMVRPDSEKLKKVKTVGMSGSDISLFQKISNWFGDKFKFEKNKKEEKPHIQELQEMVGKTQHVGEVMINDEEVLPDEERGEVINKQIKESTNTEEKTEAKINITDKAEKDDKEDIIFITKEDHEKELLREKDRTDKIVEEQDKNIAKAVDVPLGADKSEKIDDQKINTSKTIEVASPERSQNDSFGMREEVAEKGMPEDSEKMKVVLDKIQEEEKKASLWDKIKSFFSGLFEAKNKKIEPEQTKEEANKYSEIELAKIVSQQEDDTNEQSEHEVSTPVSEFATGIKVMQAEKVKEPEKQGPSLEEKPAPFMQQQEKQEKEELSKAQEELFSEVPESSEESEKPKELEDIFSSVDTPEQEPEQLVVQEEEKPSSLWDKIKSFFSHLFAPKAKEIKEELQPVEAEPQVPKAQEIKLDEAVEAPEEQVESSEENLQEKPAPFMQQQEKQEKEELSKAQEELFSEVPESSEESEKPKELEDIFSSVDTPEQEPEQLVVQEEEKPSSLWDKIKSFFSHLFAPKAKEIKELEERQLTGEQVLETKEIEQPVLQEETQETPQAQEIKVDEQIRSTEELEDEILSADETQVLEEPIEEEPKKDQLPVEEKKEELVEGAPESLPASLLSPELDMQASVHEEDIYKDQNIEIEDVDNIGESNNLIARIKNFFRKLFRSKSKEINIDDDIVSEKGVSAKENAANEDLVDYNLQDRKTEPQVIKEDELSSRFHQPEFTPNVSRAIDQEGGVDLIPIAIRTKSWGQIAQLVIAAIVGSIIIILSFYATLYFQQISLEQAKEEQQNKLSDLEEKILEYKELNEEIDTLGQELVLVNDLLNKHIYWTNLFALIEKYTLEDVYFSGFSAGAGGALSFSATGASYDSAARQLKLLQSEEAKEFIQKVTINSVAGGQGGVTFSINLILNDELFYYSQ